MDFFTKNNEKDRPTSDQPNHHPKPSKSELLNSAKVVADAAKSHLGHEENKVDKTKVVGAVADLLNAASEYGKLDDNNGLGKYLDDAENYLHKYNTSHSTTTTTTINPHHSTTTTETTHTSAHPGSDLGHSKGGYGEYIKMAEGMLKKNSKDSGSGTTDTSNGHTHSSVHSEGDHGNSGSGYGEYTKMVGDFMKKH